MFILPPLPGMQVIINPEGNSAQTIKELSQGQKIYIAAMVEFTPYEWYANQMAGNKAGRHAEIRVMNNVGWKIKLATHHFLPLDLKEARDVCCYRIGMGVQREFTEKADDLIGRAVIKEGKTLKDYINYDKKYRDDQLQRCFNYLNERDELSEVEALAIEELSRLGFKKI